MFLLKTLATLIQFPHEKSLAPWRYDDEDADVMMLAQIHSSLYRPSPSSPGGGGQTTTR